MKRWKVGSREELFHPHRVLLPVFDKQAVDEWLWGEETPIQNSSQCLAYGPGQPLVEEIFLGGSGCYINKSSQNNTFQKTIIIANIVFKKNLKEILLLNNLPEHYPCILWEGPETKLSRVEPLKGGADFWRQRHKIKPATSTAILKFIQDQHLEAERFFILDYAAYSERWGFAHTLKIEDVNNEEDFANILASVDPRKIFKLYLEKPSKETFEFCQKNFPNDRLELPKDSHLKSVSLPYPKIVTRSLETLSPEERENLQALHIEQGVLKGEEFSKLKCFSHITFGHLKLVNFFLLEYCQLRYCRNELQIEKCPNLVRLDATHAILCLTTPLPSLRFLSVGKINIPSSGESKPQLLEEYCPELEFLSFTPKGSLTLNDKLKEVTLALNGKSQFDLVTGKSLEILTIEIDSIMEGTIDLSHSTELRILKFKGLEKNRTWLIVEGYGINKISLDDKDHGSLRIDGIKFCSKLLDVWGNFSQKQQSALPKNCRYIQTNLPQERDEIVAESLRYSTLTESRESEGENSLRDQKLVLPADYKNTGVEFFSSRPTDSSDSNEGPSLVTAKGEDCLAALTLKGKGLPRHNYRIDLYTTILFKKESDQISFDSRLPVLENKDFIKISRQEFKPLADDVKGLFKGTLKLNKDYILPSYGPVSPQFVLSYDNESKETEIGYYYDSNRRQILIRMLKGPAFGEVMVSYAFLPDKIIQSLDSPKQITSKLLPLDLEEKLKVELRSIGTLKFLFDEQIDFTEKLKKLIAFCQSFKDEKFRGQDGTLQQLLQTIRNQQGVCRHRSRVFMLLAQFIGADVRMVRNPVHQYCELHTQNDRWVSIDLGGANAPNSDASDIDRNINNLQNQWDSILAASNRQLVADDRHKKWYEQKVQENRAPFPFTWERVGAKPIFITLPNGMTGRQALTKFLTFKQETAHYFYLDTPSEFERHFHSHQVSSEGGREPVRGPLQKEVFDEEGILFIDWSGFTHADMSDYQLLWSDSPRLRKIVLGKKPKIIGFLTSSTKCFPGFINEGIECAFPSVTESVPNSETDGLPTYFVYFDNENWKAEVVESLHFSQTGEITVIEKIFIEIAKLKKPCVVQYRLLINNPDCHRFLEQLQSERRFYSYYNAKWYDMSHVIFVASSQPQPSETCVQTSEWLKILGSEEEAKSEKVYLHNNNWYTLFDDSDLEYVETEIKNKYVGVTPLSKIKANPSAVFYLTENVSSHDWGRLEKYIRRHKISAPVRFQLAPGVSGPGMPGSKSRPIPSQESSPLASLAAEGKIQTSQCYYSNDPDYVTEKLRSTYQREEKEKNLLIIDLTPQMGVADLLVRVTPDSGDDKGVISFKYSELALLAALKEGKTVILQGRISPGLQQALLPLFSHSPYLEINTQRVFVKGKVILIQPEPEKEDPEALLPYQRWCFTFEDYFTALLEEVEQKWPQERRKEGVNVTCQLMTFFRIALEYPHRGSMMPKNLGMCWLTLRRMQQELLNPDTHHPQNPIKSLKLADYEIKSEYYAFLNVLGKFLFDYKGDKECKDSTSPPPIRATKLQDQLLTIQKRGKWPKDFAWSLLNTANGPTLRELLGNHWLDQSGPKMHLAEGRWEDIFKKLKERADTPSSPDDDSKQDITTASIARLSSHIKLENRLKHLIEVGTVPVIVIKGEPGVGKTHFLKEIKNNSQYRCYDARHELKAWLEDTSEMPKLALYDEANTEPDGFLDGLNGINRDPPALFYQGKWYPLTPHHKIIAAVNPESFSGRRFHDLLRTGKTEFAKLPNHAFQMRWLTSSYGISSELAELVLKGAELFKSYQPLIGVSFRALQNIMQRYQALRDDGSVVKASLPDTSLQFQMMSQAIYEEFGRAIIDSGKKDQFKKELISRLGFPESLSIQNQSFKIHGILFFAEMTEARTALEQALLIRQHRQNEDKTHTQNSIPMAYKQGLLLQGPPGIGKKKLVLTILQKIDHSPGKGGDRCDSTLDYEEIHPGDPDLRQKAVKIFDRGGILVIKNFNLIDQSHEGFINGLLTGINIDEGGRHAKRPGFLLVALNSNAVNGHALSDATRDRMEVVHVPAISNDSWIELAKELNPASPDPAALVKAVVHPEGTGSSCIFKVIKSLPNPLPDEQSELPREPQNEGESSLEEKLKLCVEKFGEDQQAKSIKNIKQLFYQEHLEPLTSQLVNRSRYSDIELIANFLYKLLIKIDNLEREKQNINGLFYTARKTRIKNEKIMGLQTLVSSILEEMRKPRGILMKTMVADVVKRFPNIFSGFLRHETEALISDLLQYYDEAPAHLGLNLLDNDEIHRILNSS